MARPTAVARSPIAPASPEVVVAGWAVSGRRSTAALVICDCSPMAKVAVKAPAEGGVAEALGVPFGRATPQSWPLSHQEVSVLVVGSGPGEWLVLAPPGTQDDVVARLASRAVRTMGQLMTVVDLTHGRALIRITGTQSTDLLAKETAVDLAGPACPDGGALRTAVAGLATEIIRDDQAGVTSYLLHCERSSGQYLFDSLLDAGAEFGVEIDGFVCTEPEET